MALLLLALLLFLLLVFNELILFCNALTLNATFSSRGQTMLSKSLCLLHQHPCNLLLLGNCLAHHSLDLWHKILLDPFGCHFQCHPGRPIFFMVQTHNRHSPALQFSLSTACFDWLTSLCSNLVNEALIFF